MISVLESYLGGGVFLDTNLCSATVVVEAFLDFPQYPEANTRIAY
jgi:hypothetical protein